MTDPAAFLAARLDEDEAEAKATADADAEFWADVKGDGTHFARHDPDHVLREVAAKRTILELYDAAATHDDASLGVATLRAVIGTLAAVYSDQLGHLP